jgi:hypothetical protein
VDDPERVTVKASARGLLAFAPREYSVALLPALRVRGLKRRSCMEEDSFTFCRVK